VFVVSLENTVTKIPVPINVRCRTCEYRLLDDAMNLERTEKNGFAECWGDLVWIDPHILDYYHVSSIGGRNSPVVNALIGQKRVKMSDVKESDRAVLWIDLDCLLAMRPRNSAEYAESRPQGPASRAR
jgi:hypothetical protein